MVAYRSYPAGRGGCHWLNTGRGDGRPSQRQIVAITGSRPRALALAAGDRHALGADPGSVRAARDFTVTTLHRWGMAERSPTSRSWRLSC